MPAIMWHAKLCPTSIFRQFLHNSYTHAMGTVFFCQHLRGSRHTEAQRSEDARGCREQLLWHQGENRGAVDFDCMSWRHLVTFYVDAIRTVRCKRFLPFLPLFRSHPHNIRPRRHRLSFTQMFAMLCILTHKTTKARQRLKATLMAAPQVKG